jgi:hypothetical protein
LGSVISFATGTDSMGMVAQEIKSTSTEVHLLLKAFYFLKETVTLLQPLLP